MAGIFSFMRLERGPISLESITNMVELCFGRQVNVSIIDKGIMFDLESNIPIIPYVDIVAYINTCDVEDAADTVRSSLWLRNESGASFHHDSPINHVLIDFTRPSWSILQEGFRKFFSLVPK